ncbi:MAG: sigma-70 family RNA polymerase sigma factor [Prevotellaceae bacterium]|jgi:RNA polymerase sigma-70 factor (ECF subfamily)|nr:sigma-70 family RNA polymerase sigma factor [Prevotellaceae bacterium]
METLKTLTDTALVELYAQGNNEAFDVLLYRHKNKVFAYIYFTVRNKELAEDIFQETFIRVITTLKQGRYAESGKFIAWVNRIAHNLIIDHFRQERSENTVSNDECADFDLLNNSKLCDGTVEDSIVQEQIYGDVRHLVGILPEEQQIVVQMRYYEGLSFKEIADKTNVSINTALGRMRYALLNMRRIADEKGIMLSV